MCHVCFRLCFSSRNRGIVCAVWAKFDNIFWLCLLPFCFVLVAFIFIGWAGEVRTTFGSLPVSQIPSFSLRPSQRPDCVLTWLPAPLACGRRRRQHFLLSWWSHTLLFSCTFHSGSRLRAPLLGLCIHLLLGIAIRRIHPFLFGIHAW